MSWGGFVKRDSVLKFRFKSKSDAFSFAEILTKQRAASFAIGALLSSSRDINETRRLG